jgi:hypothetical protein
LTDGEAEITDLSLDEVLTAASHGTGSVVRRDDDAGSVWLVADVTFATLDVRRAEFRLDPLVAGAALRTPDTGPSPRGADWVAFEPAVLDVAAVDRAEAWFLSAARRAGAGSSSRNR